MARGGVKQPTAGAPVEGPWALPEGWHWETLGNLGKWCGGGTPSKARAEFWTDGTIPWVSPKDMKRALIDSSEDQITEAAVAGSSAKTVRAGSVLCVMRSGILRHTFPVAVNTVDVTLNQDMRALTPRIDVEPRYLSYYLQFTGNTVLHTTSKAGTTVDSIEAARLDRHPVPIPDMRRQRLIVARIDELFAEVDDGEAALSRARDDLKTWRKALLKAAVTGQLTADWRVTNPATETGGEFLRRMLADRRERWDAGSRNKHKPYPTPAGANLADASALPATWSWASIQQLATVVRGASPRPAGDPRYFGGDIPWITVGSLTKGNSKYLTSVDLFVTPLGREHSRYVEPGTLLFTNSGATLGVPKIAAIGGCINDGSVALLGLEEPVKSYVYYFLRTQTERLRGLNQGAAQPNLNTTIVKEIRVPVPPQSEMTHLVSIIESFLDETDAAEDDLLQLKAVPRQLRQSILAAAFRGDLA